MFEMKWTLVELKTPVLNNSRLHLSDDSQESGIAWVELSNLYNRSHLEYGYQIVI